MNIKKSHRCSIIYCSLFYILLNYDKTAASAAAKRAIGTRNGEQDT